MLITLYMVTLRQEMQAKYDHHVLCQETGDEYTYRFAYRFHIEQTIQAIELKIMTTEDPEI